jgi:hypothetical protein
MQNTVLRRGRRERERERERMLKKKDHLAFKYSRGYTYRPIVITSIRVCLTKSKPYMRETEWKNENNGEQQG